MVSLISLPERRPWSVARAAPLPWQAPWMGFLPGSLDGFPWQVTLMVLLAAL